MKVSTRLQRQTDRQTTRRTCWLQQCLETVRGRRRSDRGH